MGSLIPSPPPDATNSRRGVINTVYQHMSGSKILTGSFTATNGIVAGSVGGLGTSATNSAFRIPTTNGTYSFLIGGGTTSSDWEMAMGWYAGALAPVIASRAGPLYIGLASGQGMAPITPDINPIGDSTHRWSNVYSNAGNFSGDVTVTGSVLVTGEGRFGTLRGSTGTDFIVKSPDNTQRANFYNAGFQFNLGSGYIRGTAASEVVLFQSTPVSMTDVLTVGGVITASGRLIASGSSLFTGSLGLTGSLTATNEIYATPSQLFSVRNISNTVRTFIGTTDTGNYNHALNVIKQGTGGALMMQGDTGVLVTIAQDFVGTTAQISCGGVFTGRGVLPQATITYDFGAVGAKWKDAYIGQGAYIDTLFADRMTTTASLDLSSTPGNVTIHRIKGRFAWPSGSTSVVVSCDKVFGSGSVVALSPDIDPQSWYWVTRGSSHFTASLSAAPSVNIPCSFFVFS
jgi:hypothetical protein